MPEGERDARSSYRNKAMESIRSGRLYRQIYRTGKRFRGLAIRAVYRRNTLGVIRLGFSVSRRAGNAVRRNLFRRRMKTLVREQQQGASCDLIVSPATGLADMGWNAMKRDFQELMEIIGEERDKGSVTIDDQGISKDSIPHTPTQL